MRQSKKNLTIPNRRQKMNDTYRERMIPLWEQLKKGMTHAERLFNHSLLKNNRIGDYLIKSTRKLDCINGNGYIDYSFKHDGWISTRNRSNAQWFTKDEAVAIAKDWKHFKIVKR